jgi:hypothetical protein
MAKTERDQLLILITCGLWLLLATAYAFMALRHPGARTMPVTMCAMAILIMAITVARWRVERRRKR